MAEYESVFQTCALKSLIIFFRLWLTWVFKIEPTQRTISASLKAYDDDDDDDDDDDSEYRSEKYV